MPRTRFVPQPQEGGVMAVGVTGAGRTERTSDRTTSATNGVMAQKQFYLYNVSCKDKMLNIFNFNC